MIPSISRTFALDLAERAGWTFVQAFVGATAVLIAGANTQNVVHLNYWQQLGAAGLTAGVSGVASLGKGVIAGIFTGTASASKTVAASAPVESIGAHAAQPAVTVPALAASSEVPPDAAAVLAQAEAIHPSTPAAST
ncbi:MAG TPA: hypothetical protein VJ851_00590 [Jatrophihabitans sp.]|nr:hypothetical protein [Jatrophihabitans sp.]